MAVDPVSTDQFSIDGHVRASDDDRTPTVTVTGEGTGSNDARRRRGPPRVPPVDVPRRSDWLHRVLEALDGWGVENASGSVEWFTLTPLGRQLGLLEHTTVYWGANRTLDGNLTVVLAADPSKRTLPSLPDVSRTPRDLPVGTIENTTFELRVDAPTDRPAVSKLGIETSVGDASGVAEFTTRYRAYGDRLAAAVDADRPARTRLSGRT